MNRATAVAELYAGQRDLVVRAIARMGYCWHDAEDAVQKASIQMLEDESMPVAAGVLVTVARCRAIDDSKRGRLERDHLDHVLDYGDDGQAVTVADVIAAPEPDVEAALLSCEQVGADKVKRWRILREMRPEHAELIRRLVLEDQTYEQAAAELGVPLNTVRSRTSRAYADFARRWARGRGRPRKRR
jgi:DNA-directed RNA polymerase specialized sigma24 family protein